MWAMPVKAGALHTKSIGPTAPLQSGPCPSGCPVDGVPIHRPVAQMTYWGSKRTASLGSFDTSARVTTTRDQSLVARDCDVGKYDCVASTCGSTRVGPTCRSCTTGIDAVSGQ